MRGSPKGKTIPSGGLGAVTNGIEPDTGQCASEDMIMLRIVGSESRPTLANLGNDYGFISKGIHLPWYEAFWVSTKQSHESLCSKWTTSYHCGESCSSNMVSEPCPKLSHDNRILKYRTKIVSL